MSSVDHHHHIENLSKPVRSNPLKHTPLIKKPSSLNPTTATTMRTRVNHHPSTTTSKPKNFEIYIDYHPHPSPSSSPTVPPNEATNLLVKHPVSKTSFTRNQRHVNPKLKFLTSDEDEDHQLGAQDSRSPTKTTKIKEHTSTKKNKTNPLEDKTNTVRKLETNLRREAKGSSSEQDKNRLNTPLTHKLLTKSSSTIKKNTVYPLENSSNHKNFQSIAILDQKPTALSKGLRSSLSSGHQVDGQIIHQSRSNRTTKIDNNSPKRLLYRTPVTSKRAQRPPNANPPHSIDSILDDQTNLSFSPSSSHYDSLQIDFSQDHIPDVEYGPPSAISESIDSAIDQITDIDFKEFYKLLKDKNVTSASSNLNYNNLLISYSQKYMESFCDVDINHQVQQIISQDGHKDLWNFEPICEITDYQGDYLPDELHLPAVPVDQLRALNKGKTGETKVINPSISLLSSPGLKATSTMRSTRRNTARIDDGNLMTSRLDSLRPLPHRSSQKQSSVTPASSNDRSSVNSRSILTSSQSTRSNFQPLNSDGSMDRSLTIIDAKKSTLEHQLTLELESSTALDVLLPGSFSSASSVQPYQTSKPSSSQSGLINQDLSSISPINSNSNLVCYRKLLNQFTLQDQIDIDHDLDEFLSSSYTNSTPITTVITTNSITPNNIIDSDLDLFRFDV